MARQPGALALAAVCVLSIQTCFSQNSSPSPAGAAGSPSQSPVALKDEASVQAWKDYFQQLPLEEKEKLAENLKRWQALSPEEREFVRQKAATRQKKMRQAAADAIAHSGLQLTPERQEAYTTRYLAERGEIERPLHQEMQRKRKPLLDDMTKKLDAEFAALPPVSDEKSQDVAAKYAASKPPQPGVPEPFQRMEIDRAIKQSGLPLDDERRQFYTWRYIQMRRKIEQQLRAELDTKRKPQLDALEARLKAEFAPAPPK